MILKFKLTSFLFAHTADKPISGVANPQRNIFGGEGGLTRQITVKSKNGVGVLEGTANDTYLATTALAKNTVSMMGLMESYEAEITGMQDVVADLREIVGSIDNVLQEFESIGKCELHLNRLPFPPKEA